MKALPRLHRRALVISAGLIAAAAVAVGGTAYASVGTGAHHAPHPSVTLARPAAQ